MELTQFYFQVKKKQLVKLTDLLETEINYFKSDANDRFARRNE